MGELLYKDDGPYQRPGGTYDFKEFPKSEVEDALKNGWFRTMTGVQTGKDPKQNFINKPERKAGSTGKE